MPELLLILPAYNEKLNIGSVIDKLHVNCRDADILVVDDGSKDDTFEVCKKLGVSVARHDVNLGLASAVRTGMKYALSKGYQYAMQFDSDGQHDETKVSAMLKEAKEGNFDIVIGSRFLTGDKPPFLKSIGKNLISFCIMLTSGAKITDPTSGMRLYNSSVMEKFALSSHFSPEPDMLAFMLRKGARVTEIPVIMHDRQSGRSYLDMIESTRYMFRMITSILVVQWFR